MGHSGRDAANVRAVLRIDSELEQCETRAYTDQFLHEIPFTFPNRVSFLNKSLNARPEPHAKAYSRQRKVLFFGRFWLCLGRSFLALHGCPYYSSLARHAERLLVQSHSSYQILFARG